MEKSCLEKLVLSLFMTGCIILCCSGRVRGSLTYADDTVVSHELDEGQNLTIDCSTTEPAYYTALSFLRDPIPLFYLVPNGQKIIQDGQTFTITNLTEQNAGDYGCLVKDKSLQNSTISKAEVVVISAKPKPLDETAQKNKTVHVVETATMKLSGSKPYIYFKVKSPLRIPMTDKKPFNISVSVKGLQPTKIQWEKDQHELVIGSRYKTFDDDRRLLVESPFTADDSGTYSASACNAKGCEVKGVQVMFYTMPNQTFRKQGDTSEQGEGFLVDWIKEYGFLGVPLFLAIVLIFAISYTTEKKKKDEKKGRKVEGFIEELELELQKPRGGGRTASLWSWHSEGDSSPDDMPDYDKMKFKKHSGRRDSSDMEHGEYPEMHDYEHYSDKEIFYDRGHHRSDHQLHEIDSNDSFNYKTTDATGAYGLQGHYSKEEVPFTTSDSRHDVASLDKVSDTRITVEQEPAQTMFGSIFGYVQRFVAPTEQPPTQVKQDTVAKETRATQDTVASDTKITQDTILTDTTITQDTVLTDSKVTQDTVVKDTKDTQESVANRETEQAGTMFGSIFGYVKRIGFLSTPEQPPTQDTQDTISSDTHDTQDTISSDTKDTQDTVVKKTQDAVVKENRATQDTVDSEARGTQATIIKETQDTVVKETRATEDTVVKETLATQDKLVSDIKATQDTVVKDTKGTQETVVNRETEQAGTMFGSIFGYVQHQVKRIEGFVSTNEPPPTQDTQNTVFSNTQDTVSSDTQDTQDTVFNDTQDTQDTVSSDAQGTQDTVVKETQDAVVKENRATQDTVVKETRATQDTVLTDTKVTQDTVLTDTKVTQDTVLTDTKVTQDTVLTDTKVTQDTVVKETRVTQDTVLTDIKETQETVANRETEQAETMFGSIFGYVKRIGFLSTPEPPPTQDTQDTISSDTKDTQDTVVQETQDTQDTVVKENRATQDTIDSEAQVIQDTVVKEARATQDTVVKETRATQDTVVKEARATQDTVVKEAPATQDTVVKEAPATQDTVVKEAPAAQDTVVKEAPATQDTVVKEARATQDTVVNDTQVTQGTGDSDIKATRDTVDSDAQVTQDTVVTDTKFTQATVVTDTKVTQDPVVEDTQETVVNRETEQAATMFGTMFGYVQHQVKQIEGFSSTAEQPPAQVTQDTVVMETRATQDTDTSDAQAVAVKENQATQETVVKEIQVTEGTGDSDTKVTQDTIDSDTKVTQDTVGSDTKVTQDTVDSDTQMHDLPFYPDFIDFD